MELPQAFLERVKAVPGLDVQAFLAGFEAPRRSGLRLNGLKIPPETFERAAPFHLKPIPFVPGAYEYDKEDAVSRHPFYHAGLYYLQEPSAMLPADILAPRPGERVLDLCAAPGGKATALGAMLGGRGVLVANDISTARCRALLRNVELFGIRNAAVTNAVPAKLAGRFGGWFDCVLLDAPCSGEGMFRKDPDVLRDWSEEKSRRCAAIQKELILLAADMLRPGGRMVYSTCTFSPQENEEVITHLLRSRPEMRLAPIARREGFSPGVCPQDLGAGEIPWEYCVRIWPHLAGGEGHFTALLTKEAGGAGPWKAAEENARGQAEGGGQSAGGGREAAFRGREKAGRKATKVRDKRSVGSRAGSSSAHAQAMDLLRGFWGGAYEALFAGAEPDMLQVRGEKVFLETEAGPLLSGIPVLRSGWYIGDLRRDRFEPSQACALALKGTEGVRCLRLQPGDERLERYLRGETFEAGEAETQDGPGWYLICADRFPLGWGKLTGSTMKNKYPAGWRRN